MHTSSLLRRKILIGSTGPVDFQREMTAAEDEGWKVIPESFRIECGDHSTVIYGVIVEKNTDDQGGKECRAPVIGCGARNRILI